MKWRRYAVSVAAIWVVVVAIYALRPYTWRAQPQPTVPGTVRTVSLDCGPLWGSGYVHPPPSSISYAYAGTPCGSRSKDRLMTAVDLAVGIGVILLVCWWPIEGEERRGAFTWPFRSGASNLAS